MPVVLREGPGLGCRCGRAASGGTNAGRTERSAEAESTDFQRAAIATRAGAPDKQNPLQHPVRLAAWLRAT